MKLIEAIGTAALSLILAVGVSAFPQQDQHEQEEKKDKPAAQEHEKNAKPEKAPKEEKDARQHEQKTQSEEHHAQQKDNNQDERRAQPEHTQAVNSGRSEERSGDGAKRRIPEDRYRANFGREHRFRVSEGDYRRDRRFQYGGYWFAFAQPWPSSWLYTQEVYVVEIDGVYYLCNAEYPGVNITLNVTL